MNDFIEMIWGLVDLLNNNSIGQAIVVFIIVAVLTAIYVLVI